MATYVIMFFDVGHKLQKQEVKNNSSIPSVGQLIIKNNKTYVVDDIQLTDKDKTPIVKASLRL